MAYENLPRLPDPTTVPAGPGFVSISPANIMSGMVHYLNTGAAVSVRNDGSYWELSIQYPELTPSEFATIGPFLESVSGGFENFYVQNPLMVNPSTGAWDTSTNTKIALGAITIAANTGNRGIVIPSWSTRGGNFTAGDGLKFTNSNKIYRVSKTTLVSDTMTVMLSAPILEPAKIPTAGLEPNGIMFRVRTQEGFSLKPEFTTRGLYSAFSITLKESIL